MSNLGFRKQPKGFATKAIHVGQSAEQWKSHCVVPPIVTSSIFTLAKPDECGEFFYGRTGNPTRKVLETCLAALEDGKFALTFSSGMGAIMAAFSILKHGDHIICSYDIYGGTSIVLKKQSSKFGIEVDFVDATDLNELKKFIKTNTKMIFIESPTNPLLRVIDIQAVADIMKSYSNQKITLVVDNTFLTPYYQRPLELGADIVVHSMTKFLNGHSDVIMGAAITNCPKLYDELRFSQKAAGVIPSPFDCYQVNRSLKTLALRMEQHSKSSLAIAKYLEAHKFVESVFHPGLQSHPQHKIALKQSYGHSGIMAFYIKGDLNNTKKFMNSLKLFKIAGSLGGTESLVCIPAVVSHSSLSMELRTKLGITDNFIRISVGLEDVDDLINDLENSLAISQ